jgi:hypothetical protein
VECEHGRVSTDVDVPVEAHAADRPGRGGRRGWWLVPELLAVVALAGTLIYQSATALTPAELRLAVAARAEQVMESLPVDEHHDHGHEVAEASRIVCGVEPIGYEPADATRMSQVRVVYGSFLCASGPPGSTFETAYKFSGPVIMELREPPVVKTVPLNAPYREGVVALMPDRYEGQALAGFADPEIPRQVVQRFNEVSSPPPGP